MSKTELIDKKTHKLSAGVRKFWGPPQCLDVANEEGYWRFAAVIIDGFDPIDPIMLVLVKDFVDHSFQIRELRKLKANLLKLEQATKLGQAAPKNHKKLLEYLRSDVGETETFLDCMRSFVEIDKIIADTERRRDDALAQIESYREAVATRLRRNAEAAVIEGEVIEADAACTADPAAGSDDAVGQTAVATAPEMLAIADPTAPLTPAASPRPMAERSDHRRPAPPGDRLKEDTAFGDGAVDVLNLALPLESATKSSGG
jgi:hypothetical protein